ncbi:hypothetical protein BGW80DRAFT_1306539 [Lactifluus volemus]|nr:hypothetical protein BGW80DRAFT_1306539 [Lactifluus volemus]
MVVVTLFSRATATSHAFSPMNDRLHRFLEHSPPPIKRLSNFRTSVAPTDAATASDVAGDNNTHGDGGALQISKISNVNFNSSLGGCRV